MTLKFMRLAMFKSNGMVLNGNVSKKGILVDSNGKEYLENEVTFLPPVSPTKMIGLVLNYSDHADELGLAVSSEPVLFLKPNSTLLGHKGNIVYPKGGTFVHYEAELAVVISKRARNVKEKSAEEYIKGFTIANEITCRDFISNTFRPPVKAKGFDTFCPLGPYLVTKDEIEDPANLNIRTLVNGSVRQEGNTKNLIHKIPRLIEFITEFMTLEEDDIILTGTPKGISPIVPGDLIEISIDSLGTLTNRVVAEQSGVQ